LRSLSWVQMRLLLAIELGDHAAERCAARPMLSMDPKVGDYLS